MLPLLLNMEFDNDNDVRLPTRTAAQLSTQRPPPCRCVLCSHHHSPLLAAAQGDSSSLLSTLVGQWPHSRLPAVDCADVGPRRILWWMHGDVWMAAQQQVLDYVNDRSANALLYCLQVLLQATRHTDNNLRSSKQQQSFISILYAQLLFKLQGRGHDYNYIIENTRHRICSFLSDWWSLLLVGFKMVCNAPNPTSSQCPFIFSRQIPLFLL